MIECEMGNESQNTPVFGADNPQNTHEKRE
jgi:hypothetical protein